MYSEKQELQIEITSGNCIQVRITNIVLKDNVMISRTYDRSCYSPLDDVSNCDQKIQDIAAIIWTDEVKEAYRTLMNNSIGK